MKNSALSTLIDIGKSARSFLVHICSPRTLRVAHEESSFGDGNNRGFSKNQVPTETAWRQLRFQTGTYTSGLVNTLVHTLQGFECLFHVCSFMIAIYSPFPSRLPYPGPRQGSAHANGLLVWCTTARQERDRKSTRLNSSHANISYAVFCLKKKKNKNIITACPKPVPRRLAETAL